MAASASAAILDLRSNVARAFDEARINVGVSMKEIAFGAAQAVAGADRVMSNWRKGRGIKLDAGFEVEGDDVVLSPRPVGIWALWQAGAGPHFIPGKKSIKARGRGRNRRMAVVDGVAMPQVRNPDGRRKPTGTRPFVRHPGIRGRGTWDKVHEQVDRDAPDIVAAAFVKAVS